MASTTAKNGKDHSVSQQDLSDQIATIKAEIAGLTSLLAEAGLERKEQVKATAQEQAELAADQARKLGNDAQAFVTARPGAALGIAAGLGFLVGFLGSRK